MTVEQRIREAELSPAERRIAEEVLANPQTVAFGTVAALADVTGTSGATVVRLATKLGYEGFPGLQADVRAELADRLGPPAHRIATAQDGDLVTRMLGQEVANLETTLRSLDRAEFSSVVTLLADLKRKVVVVPGDCARGVGRQLVDQLFALRPGVSLVDANPLGVGRELAAVERGDVVIAVGYNRYDRTVLMAADVAVEAAATVVALTDNRLGPLAKRARHVFMVSTLGVGPFDSQVATHVVGSALVAGVADKLRAQAGARLHRAEDMWQRMNALEVFR